MAFHPLSYEKMQIISHQTQSQLKVVPSILRIQSKILKAVFEGEKGVVIETREVRNKPCARVVRESIELIKEEKARKEGIQSVVRAQSNQIKSNYQSRVTGIRRHRRTRGQNCLGRVAAINSVSLV